MDPNSATAHKMNVTLKQDNINEKTVTEKIETSPQNIKEIVKKINEEERGNLGYTQNFQVKLYNQMPTYRLVLIDHTCAYLSFYRLGSDGSKIKQLVIKPLQKVLKRSIDNNIYEVLVEYFENLWNSEETIEYDLNL